MTDVVVGVGSVVVVSEGICVVIRSRRVGKTGEKVFSVPRDSPATSGGVVE